MAAVQNAADEKQVERGKYRELRGRDREIKVLEKQLSTPEGREFVWNLLGRCRMFKLSHVNSGAETAFNEGHRDVGLPLFADVTGLFPDKYLLMTQEAKKREESNV